MYTSTLLYNIINCYERVSHMIYYLYDLNPHIIESSYVLVVSEEFCGRLGLDHLTCECTWNHPIGGIYSEQRDTCFLSREREQTQKVTRYFYTARITLLEIIQHSSEKHYIHSTTAVELVLAQRTDTTVDMAHLDFSENTNNEVTLQFVLLLTTGYVSLRIPIVSSDFHLDFHVC